MNPDKSYFIDRDSSDLWHFSNGFVTKIKNYVCLEKSGQYLFYDSNNAVAIETDFRGTMTVLCHEKSVADFFNASSLIFDDCGIIVFDIQDRDSNSFIRKTTSDISGQMILDNLDLAVNVPLTRQRSMLSCLPINRSNDSAMSPDEPRLVNYIYSRAIGPKKIMKGPYGYGIGGYYVSVMKVHGRKPTGFSVYDMYGHETQEPLVLLLHPKKK